jgi:hypothetical protein
MILMMDYATTRAQSEEVLHLPPTPTPRAQWGLAEATVAGAMVSSSPPTAGEVDRLYRHLMEIHTIGATS